MKIILAIVAGERDSGKWANLRDIRRKEYEESIRAPLTGKYSQKTHLP